MPVTHTHIQRGLAGVPWDRNAEPSWDRNAGQTAVQNNERRSARYCRYTMLPYVPHRSQLHQLSPATR